MSITNAIRQYPQTWTTWWGTLSFRSRWLPLFLILLYWAALVAVKGLRPDHIQIGLAILVLNFGGPRFRELFKVLLPFFLVAISYDSMRFYSDYIRADYIRVQEPYHFDKYFFGINTPEGRLTPNEWWQKHTHPILDLFAGFAYLTFIAEYALFTLAVYYWWGRKGTKKFSAAAVRAKSLAMGWAFFWVNIIGYTTYYWYPAAPPWYVTNYGLGPANMSAMPNPAGCLRFDALLGTHFFTGMYGKSADVFGAIPSLHVAYPLHGILFAFALGVFRPFSIFFYILMCFSAVYLNHHYVLDILWGSAYAILVYAIQTKYFGTKDNFKL